MDRSPLAFVVAGIACSRVLAVASIAAAQPIPPDGPSPDGIAGATGAASSRGGSAQPLTGPATANPFFAPPPFPSATGAAAESRPRVALPLEGPLDPKTYVVDQGDVLAARLWGAENFEIPLTVDPDGRLFVPRVGYVEAHGRTLAAVDEEVLRLLKRRYPRLQVAVTLQAPRSFLVRVTGAVPQAGASLTVNGFNRASDAIRRAGGILPGGSSRRIELHRGGSVESVDLVVYPLFGDRSHDPLLLDGDWLHVPFAERSVTISGGVNRPGSYELVAGSFAELLRLAGGLTPEASDRFGLRVASVEGDGRRMRIVPFHRDRPDAIALDLRHHDAITVPTLDDGARIVVKGALGTLEGGGTRADPRVADPGAAPVRETTVALPFVDGETVRGAILKAGGLAPWADLGNAWIEHSGGGRTADDGKPAALTRPDTSTGSGGGVGAKVRLASLSSGANPPETPTEEPPAPPRGERMAVDLRSIFIGHERDKDVRLLPGDTVFVPSARTDVVVSGHVMRPGVYGYSLRLTASDYIALAGGETREGSRSSAKVVSADGRSRSASGERLQPGDSIVVPGKTLTTAEWVTISLGAVSIGLSAAVLGYTLSHR